VTSALSTLDELATTVDLVALHGVAVRTSIDVVSRVDATTDLGRLTPCPAWTLYGLLAHMITQHHGFTASARGATSLSDWLTVRLEPDPVGQYRTAAESLLAEFARDDVLGRAFVLPELSTTQQFTGAQAVSFHLIDYVVHAWDVARALGTTVTFDPDVLDAALVVARSVPQGPARTRPGAAFGPAIAWPAGGLDEILAMLGRAPNWPQ
jgi:uncharacterized protein (TIGR03086 family)